MDYFNKMDGAGGYVRANLLGLSQGVSPLHDPLRLHPLHTQMTDKDALLRPLSDYSPLHLLPFSAPPFLPHHLDPRLPFNPSAFHPLHKLHQPQTSNTNTCSISSTLSGSAFAPLPGKVGKLQSDSINPSNLFSHSSLLSSLDQRNVFLGPSPPGVRTTTCDDRRDSPSPRGSNGSRESPGHIRESSTPASPGEDTKLRKTIPSGDPWCPVCGMTLRTGEIESHLAMEIDKLARIPQGRKPNQRSNTPTSIGGTNIQAPTPHSPNMPPLMRSRDPGYETFQRIRANRQMRIRTKKRKTGRDEATCPVCAERISANSPEEYQTHMDQCIRRASLFGLLQHNVVEEEDIDVEGDSYDDLDWLNNRRGRTAALLRAQHLQVKNEMEVSSEKEVTSATPEKGSNLCDTASPDGVNSTKEEGKQCELLEKELELLREKIKVMEKNLVPKYVCKVCQGEYDRPSISQKCFHIFCENCWPRPLNNKGECPTCTEAFTPEDLKNVHL